LNDKIIYDGYIFILHSDILYVSVYIRLILAII